VAPGDLGIVLLEEAPSRHEFQIVGIEQRIWGERGQPTVWNGNEGTR
jgi:hypothetical protein